EQEVREQLKRLALIPKYARRLRHRRFGQASDNCPLLGGHRLRRGNDALLPFWKNHGPHRRRQFALRSRELSLEMLARKFERDKTMAIVRLSGGVQRVIADRVIPRAAR